MTKDKDIKENLELLDKIISYLINNCTHYHSTFDELYKQFTGRVLSEDKDFNSKNMFISLIEKEPKSVEDYLSTPMSDNTRAEGEKLVLACYYLYKQELIQLSSAFDLKLTFDGIIEYGKGGFYKKFKSEKYRSWFDYFNVYATIAISLASLVVGLLFG